MKAIVVLLFTLVIIISMPASMAEAASAKSRPPVVVIDPGHGGKDPGAIRDGVKEKDLNLDISKRLRTLLKASNIRTYMTRSTDRTVSLYGRSALANRVNADLFISIHNNSGKKGDKGTMTLYYPGSTQTSRGLQGRDIASIVQNELLNKLGTKNLGLYSRAKLAVLRTTKMPAIIAEVGYMSDQAELAKLKSASFRQKSAEALKKAILKSLGR